jgi:hypothetical protein
MLTGESATHGMPVSVLLLAGQDIIRAPETKPHQLGSDPAIVLLAKIVNGADTDNSLWNQPEAAGLNAIAQGFRHLGFEDDQDVGAKASEAPGDSDSVAVTSCH